MQLALAQLDITAGEPSGNRERAREAIEDAADRGADLVALPEIFTVGYFAFDSYARTAEPLDGETMAMIADIAANRGVGVLAGSFVEDLEASRDRGFDTPAEEGYANTSVFFDREGTRRGVYRKHHLFGYDSQEQDLLTPGETLSVVDVGGFTIGTTTCYDLRFPTLYRRLLDEGVDLVLVPSAWPYPRVEHWRILPQARAIENLCYVATVNGTGNFEEAALVGRSTVYDPWGTQIAGIGEEPGIVMADIDPAAVERRRDEFPALADRRL
jgi:predicted amidohydrolase